METKSITWEELPEQAKSDLTEWYDAKTLTKADKRLLAELYADCLFHAWDCPTCGQRVYHGEPENWDDFQGVCEMDTCSYPGFNEIFTAEIIERQCDNCRCHLNPTVGDWTQHEDTGL